MSYQYVCGGSHLLGIDPLPINLYGNKTLATIGREIQDYYAENDFRYSYLLFRLTR